MSMMTLDELKSELLKNPNVKREYDALEEEFKRLAELIDRRQKAGLTQEDPCLKDAKPSFD